MNEYKHILFAADLVMADDDSIKKKVILLKNQNNAKLSILHVIEKSVSMSQTYEIPTFIEWENEIETTAKERLEKISKELGIKDENRHLLFGQPKQKILELAEKLNIDLIVVGSHAKNRIGWLLLGSTASAVLQHAKCDVLAVRV